ncbi:TPA: DUF7167 family protein [Enterobacter hormaechei subsp. steigerwaltii]|uniref:DUF7167 family protein n=1 Tax=Enterobacter hormaechei TaxID=158836 RepID=UPI0018C28CAB|nr:hypothetical protein [Enterobacter hormaechei]MCU3541957.1 hypothetical protein [Enterobacter hormaechei subsp. steigerwaltii]MBG0529399.1 hypothetical protein [Enterobacter hormaechei]MBK4236923.1 hypothetical protein [Enterobacter hormaechei]HDS5157224.1 hypothetical protein [Enterobacter hormaechei subsp. steigerwaltii]HDS5194734.1 hypothetical protein [Enterobacter hormaechei subsp. steigerwaltii]
MGRKFKVWLDSGANQHSNYEQEVDIEEDLNITSDEWDALSETEKDEVMRDVAWDRMDWGFVEIESE